MFQGKIIKSYLLLLVIFILAGNAINGGLPPVGNLINLQGSPLKILTYYPEYIEDSKSSTKGIVHRIMMKNISGQEVVAYKMLFVSFDSFNEFINKIGGYSNDSILPNEMGGGVWRTHPFGDFSFLTGVAFVQKVRFADGSVWSAKQDVILAELKKIEKGFDVSLLKEKDKEEK